MPTLIAAAGDPNVKEKLLRGYRVGNMNYKVHLDGYNLIPFFKRLSKSPRKEFFYWNDDGQLIAVRYDKWKVVFAERAHGLSFWEEPFVQLRFPKLFDLRADPFERADRGSISYPKWRVEHAFVLVPAQETVEKYLNKTFKEFSPRQKPASFSLEE